MKIKDLYVLLDNIYNLKGVHIIDGADMILYTKEALGMCYLEHSNIDIKEFSYKNGYINIYV